MFCAIPSQLPTLLPIARLLNNTKQYKPIVVFDLSFQENLILVRTCLNYGLTCVDYRNPYALLENDVYFTRRSTLSYSEVNGRARILEQYLPERIQRFFRVFRLITNYIKMIKKLVSYYKPIANIIPYETVGYFFDSVPLIAGRKRITTIIVPFCFVKKQTTAEWLFNKTPEKRTSVFISKLVNLAWPQWGMQYKNRLMLRESLPWIIASELLGIAKPNPWIDNDGYSDIIAIESSYMEKCYISEGVNISKVRIIGSLRHDEMYRAFIDQESIRKTLLIESKFGELLPKRWVLISLPEVFSFSDRVCEFNTHEEICEALIRPVLNKEDILAIISLHPRLPIEQVSHLQRKNIYISTRSITELLPCCDVFATVSPTCLIPRANNTL